MIMNTPNSLDHQKEGAQGRRRGRGLKEINRMVRFNDDDCPNSLFCQKEGLRGGEGEEA